MKTPKCPFCDSDIVVLAGTRKLHNNRMCQMFRCNACMRRFSSLNRTGKRTEGRALLQSLIFRCRGYFDEHDVFLFEPRKPAREHIKVFLCEEGALVCLDEVSP